VKHLPDVNVLVALHDPLHPHHSRALAWFSGLSTADRMFTSPVTELGMVRVLKQRRVPTPVSIQQAQAMLAALRALPRVDFVADDLGAGALPAYVQKAKDTTDGHLLALARRHGASLVTFDEGIPGAERVP
jgi:uncharacterized protein